MYVVKGGRAETTDGMLISFNLHIFYHFTPLLWELQASGNGGSDRFRGAPIFLEGSSECGSGSGGGSGVGGEMEGICKRNGIDGGHQDADGGDMEENDLPDIAGGAETGRDGEGSSNKAVAVKLGISEKLATTHTKVMRVVVVQVASTSGNFFPPRWQKPVCTQLFSSIHMYRSAFHPS